MQDKDFLDYFNKLGPSSTIDELKTASSNIVNTLIASTTTIAKRRASSIDENDSKAKKVALLYKKYSTGDLGEKMGADLNYTLKRLVRGLSSDNHTVKRGFFLTTVQVCARFKKQVDLLKLINFVNEETITSKMMKNPEINALVLGKLMCHSAFVESHIC